MNQADLDQMVARIRSKIKIFPSWEGRQLDDAREEYDAHNELEGYTYPLPEMQDAIKKEQHYDHDNDGDRDLFSSANENLNELDKIIKDIAKKMLERARASGIQSQKSITDVQVDRVAREVTERHKEKCVLKVPDFWYPHIFK